MIELGPVRVPEHELEFSAVRASGPGGQHVNKVSTAVVLRFDSRRSSLPRRYRDGLLRLGDRRVSADGVVTIKAGRHRSQERNRADALRRLADLLLRAGERPKRRVPTRPGAAARQRRLDGKRRRGRTKSLRRPPGPGD